MKVLKLHEPCKIICGEVHIEIAKRFGRQWIRRRFWVPNLITDVGKNVIRDLLLGSGIAPAAIAVGTGSTAPAAGDTGLGLEVFRNIITRRLSADKKATFQLFLNVNEANGFTLTEAGLFNSTVTGNPDLLARTIYSPVVKDNTVQVTYTWEWTML